MANLKDTIISGSLRVTNKIYGDLTGNADSATKLGSSNIGSSTQPIYLVSGVPTACTYTLSKSVPSNADFTNTWRGIQDNLTSSTNTTESLSAKQGYLLANGSARDNTKLPLEGGTMTGTITAKGNVYTDSYTGTLNMNNSNIYGVNSIYTCDASDNAAEGIHFYRDSTHVDTLWMNGGDLLFVPNRALGTSTTKADSQKVGRFTSNPTSGQVVISDGTTGGIKTSGYTIAKSVPSDAKFTDTTYTSKSESSGGTDVSLVTTGEKYTWNHHTHTKSQITDFPTSMTPTSHTHGNIQNGGTLQTNDITIASGDKIIVTDSSDSSKIARTSISFDGSTTNKCLTQKGTWESFTNNAGTVTSIATSGAITGGTITSSGTISHSTAAGYKHIPSGGSANQILEYSASGTASWIDRNVIIDLSGTNCTQIDGNLNSSTSTVFNNILTVTGESDFINAAIYIKNNITKYLFKVKIKGYPLIGRFINTEYYGMGTYDYQFFTGICGNDYRNYRVNFISYTDPETHELTSCDIEISSIFDSDNISSDFVSDGGKLKHSDSGITAGTYQSVTVNKYGHVTAGSNYGFYTAGTDYAINLNIQVSKGAANSYKIKTITFSPGTYIINGYIGVSYSNTTKSGFIVLGLFTNTTTSSSVSSFHLFDRTVVLHNEVGTVQIAKFSGIKTFTENTTVYFLVSCDQYSFYIKNWSIQSFKIS